jgi:hypothetical protein
MLVGREKLLREKERASSYFTPQPRKVLPRRQEEAAFEPEDQGEV